MDPEMATTATLQPLVHGQCEDRFSGVRDIFAQRLTDETEVGASLAVMIEGKMVIDIWGGYADAARTRPWQEDTVAVLYSSGKAWGAICVLMLIDRGLIDVEQTVATYWPGFAQAGKAGVTVRQVLSMECGLCEIPIESVADYHDWDKIVGLLEVSPPLWEPGTAHGYHPLTFTYMLGEIVRKVTGKTVGQFLRHEVSDPLGIDVFVGDGQNLGDQLAGMVWDFDRTNPVAAEWCKFLSEMADSDRARAAENPGGGALANARAFAKFYGALALGGALGSTRILSQGAVELSQEESHAPWIDLTPMGDLPPLDDTRFSVGWMLSNPLTWMGPSPRAYGWAGSGGSMGFADPDARLSFGFVMNRYQMRNPPQQEDLIKAIYAAL